jgi:hypothetical protein
MRTIWNDMELERSGTFVTVRRTFRQESYERPYLYVTTVLTNFYGKIVFNKKFQPSHW